MHFLILSSLYFTSSRIFIIKSIYDVYPTKVRVDSPPAILWIFHWITSQMPSILQAFNFTTILKSIYSYSLFNNIYLVELIYRIFHGFWFAID